MKKFLLFVVGLIALSVLLTNVGPMVLLGASIWLLYVVFKQFLKTDSIFKKIGWIVLGLIILSITMSHIYAVIGFAAAYVMYLIYKEWKEKKTDFQINNGFDKNEDDPFTNFEKQWAELTK